MSSRNKAIGGYFELEIPESDKQLYPQAHKYQSARAAFLALLQHLPHVRRVWMPYYICDSMLAPVAAAGKEIGFYRIDETFTPVGPIALHDDDILLYVNYFGVCHTQALRVLENFDAKKIVVDCSQSFYSQPYPCLGTLYSPRKFFGVPDGGLLVTDIQVTPPEIQDIESVDRSFHLIRRLGLSAEDGYEYYRKAEHSLNEIEPKRMSALTDRLLSSIHYEYAMAARAKNFDYLNERLGESNQLHFTFSPVAALCYPYLPRNTINKEQLILKKIYIPTYWPDVLGRVDAESVESKLVCQIVPIPIDQRYNSKDLDVVIEEIES